MSRRLRILDLQSISIQPSIRELSLVIEALDPADELIVALSWYPNTGYEWGLAELPPGLEAAPAEHLIPEGADPADFEEIFTHFRFKRSAGEVGGVIRLLCARPDGSEGLSIEISFE